MLVLGAVWYSKLATANSVLISQGPLAHGVSGAKTKEKERGSLLTAAGRLADHVAPALLLQVALLLADQDQHIMSGPPRWQVVTHRPKSLIACSYSQVQLYYTAR